MASFNLANVFFFCLFVYIKAAYSSSESLVTLETTNDYLKYKFQDGVKCVGVEYDGMELMKLDPNTQPKSVVFSSKGGRALVNFDGSFDLLSIDNGSFESLYSGTKHAKSINVAFKDSCENYGVLLSKKVYTYIPIEDKLFNRVRYHPVNGKGVVLFETDDVFDLVEKVVYDESIPNYLSVTTYHLNGLTRTFVRRNGGLWTHVPAKDFKAKISSGKVKFTVLSQKPKGVKLHKDDKYLNYSFEDGFKGLGVDCEGSEVINFDREKPLPTSLLFTVTGNRVFVNFKDSIDILRLENRKWKSVFSGKPKLDLLDIAYRSSNDVYTYSKSGKVHTFTAKKGRAFMAIQKQGGCFGGVELVWSTRYVGLCATKVEYDNSNSKNKVLTIHGLSGLTKKFVKGSSGLWKEVPAKDAASVLSEDKVEFVMKVTPGSEAAESKNETSEGVEP